MRDMGRDTPLALETLICRQEALIGQQFDLKRLTQR
jgi:hypothetical protein